MAFELLMRNEFSSVDFLSGIMGGSYHLQDGGLIIEEPEENITWTPTPEGDVIADYYLKSRRVIIRFDITGASHEHILGRIANINNMIRETREAYVSRTNVGKVELKLRFETADTASYFQVITGTLNLPDDIMSVGQVHQRTAGYGYIIFGFELELICLPRVYAGSIVTEEDLVEIPIYNPSVSLKVTGGLVVDNAHDTDDYSYAFIDADDVPGDQEIPTKLYLIQNNASLPISKMIIGLTEGQLAVGDWVFEAEDGTYSNHTASTQADATASDGNFKRITIGNTTIQSITASQDMTLSGSYRLFAVFAAPPHSDIVLKATVSHSGSAVSVEGPLTFCDGVTELLDLGLFNVPINLPILEDVADVSITLSGYTTGSSRDIDLDCLLMFPIGSGLRILDVADGSLTQTNKMFVDDGIKAAQYYCSLDESGKIGALDAHFAAISLVPNRDQTIFFKLLDSNAAARADMQIKLQVFILPSSTALVG